ncbi:uncharacterized protein LOC109141189 isoform X2 [Larimichthys crocea]|uniref:uncharacterized protein LOC109141189 isoform X2 n=1 Tax=Larimichthys crocea TaxID=215358 RepID=UPI000F5F6C40|nr:uncharacterized protein LOC109141189 isoform X2 [Larimichthys crocea]
MVPDLEMLMPCGNKLVTPKLSRGQQLDASMVHKIFRRAPLYIRPSVALEPTMKEGCDSSTEEDDWVEEEDMFVPATAVAQASCSTEQKAQASSSQPSTSDQTPNCWPYSRPHLYAPATAVAQASCSTQQEVQMFSSQPSTSDQTPNRWPDPRPQVYAPATAVAQASCSTQQKAQASSSQPSTRDQTPSQCQNDYGTYIDLIHETSDEDNDDDLYSAIIASIEDQT